MISKINTKYSHQYLLDYLYKNLKDIRFAKEKENNYCSVMLWKNEERITVIRFLLILNWIFTRIGVKKKHVKFSYSTNISYKDKKYLNVLVPITDLQIFTLFLLSLINQGLAKMQYKYDEKNYVKGIVYLFPLTSYKVKCYISREKPLFMNFIYCYINLIRILKEDPAGYGVYIGNFRRRYLGLL